MTMSETQDRKAGVSSLNPTSLRDLFMVVTTAAATLALLRQVSIVEEMPRYWLPFFIAVLASYSLHLAWIGRIFARSWFKWPTSVSIGLVGFSIGVAAVESRIEPDSLGMLVTDGAIVYLISVIGTAIQGRRTRSFLESKNN